LDATLLCSEVCEGVFGECCGFVREFGMELDEVVRDVLDDIPKVEVGTLVLLKQLRNTRESNRIVENKSTIRTFGRIKQFQVDANWILIEHGNVCCELDVSKVHGLNHKLGDIIEVTGRVLFTAENTIKIIVRILRNISNIDMELCEQSILCLQEFMKKWNSNSV